MKIIYYFHNALSLLGSIFLNNYNLILCFAMKNHGVFPI